MKDLNLDEDNVYDSSGGKTEPYSLRKRTKHASTIAKDDEKNEEKDTRVRKVSKLAASLSTGKAPKSGQHGPRGVVRPRVEGFMWYQDPNTGEWSEQ